MEIRNEEENAVLHMLLENINIWPEVKKLVCVYQMTLNFLT